MGGTQPEPYPSFRPQNRHPPPHLQMGLVSVLNGLSPGLSPHPPPLSSNGSIFFLSPIRWAPCLFLCNFFPHSIRVLFVPIFHRHSRSISRGCSSRSSPSLQFRHRLLHSIPRGHWFHCHAAHVFIDSCQNPRNCYFLSTDRNTERSVFAPPFFPPPWQARIYVYAPRNTRGYPEMPKYL